MARERFADYSDDRKAAYWRWFSSLATAQALMGLAVVLAFIFTPGADDPNEVPLTVLIAFVMLASFTLTGVSIARILKYLRIVQAEKRGTQVDRGTMR